MKRNRVENLKPWTKGQSGNPRGRPKAQTPAVRHLARDASPAAVQKLIDIAALPHEKADGATLNAIIRAAEAVLKESGRTPNTATPADISTIEDLIKHATRSLGEQFQRVSTPSELAQLLRATADLLKQNRELDEEVRGLSDDEITKRIEAGG